MISGLRLEPDLQSRQVCYMIGRLAMQVALLSEIVRSAVTEKKTPAAKLELQAQYDAIMKRADDPGNVLSFIAEHSELLPESMR
jgi:hypothetical protein